MTFEISITKMPDAELVRIINVASAELARRMQVQLPELPAASVVPSDKLSVTTRDDNRPPAPDRGDRDFCLHIAQRLRSGEYIKAGERERVAQIAAAYPNWARLQSLPAGKGTGPWRKAAAMYQIGFSKER